MRTLLALFPLLAACFPENPGGVILRCDPMHPCPQGQVCLNNNTCGPGAGDMGTAGEMGAASGCTVQNGIPLGLAFACPVASLATGQAKTLCAPGYTLCTSANALQGAPQCNQLDGFFAAEVPGAYTGVPGQVTAAICGAMAGQYRVFFGCGKLSLPIVHAVLPCNGFSRLLDCQASGSGWTCQAQLNDTSTTVPAGVLCCPMGS